MTGMLFLTEKQAAPREVVFEAVSAFGTVGLSLGLTPRLTVAGRWVVMALMLIGRVGILTAVYAFARPRLSARVHYAEEYVMIG